MGNFIKENFFYFIIGIAIFGISALLAPKTHFKPQGVFLPNTSNTTNTLGLVNAEIHAHIPMENKKIEITNFAKQLAKQYGAKDLVITHLSYEPTLGSYQLAAIALEK